MRFSLASQYYRGNGGRCRPVNLFLHRLPAELLDLFLQFFVFRDLAAREADGDPALLLYSLGGQDVGARYLVAVLAEPFGLDPALIDKGPETIIDLAQADAHGTGQGPL